MPRNFLIAFAFTISLTAAEAQLKWPAITQQTKPWTRWWWEGSAVDKPGLTWNLEKLQAAGLGGVEITPIYGIYGFENRFIDFLSPQWMQMFTHTLAEAKRLNMGVDLANGTGWPFGGPWVKDEDASRSVYFKNFTLQGGQQLKDTIHYWQEAMVRTANNKTVSIDTLVQPVAKNKNLQGLALDQIKYPGLLPLQALMAYSDKGAVLDLTKNVNSSGMLNWTAPPGKWDLYAVFSGLHGKMVERAAPGGEGYAIDHFSAPAAKNYFKRFDAAFKGHDITYLRAFFNDSYEVDDARGQGNWTSAFFTEFKKRRGYDLKDHLPALFGKDSAEKNRRVIYDYRATIDELLLEHFTIAWKNWGHSKGARIRNQSHGSPANTLDLYSAVDIPETEGTDILRFKFATSAANVTGKPLVSSESATWLDEHFLSSWGDVKKILDLFFLGGVNHVFYHGNEYSPKDVAWPGWLFYAAVHFQPTNPQWQDFPVLNQYVSRVQSFLQSGRPDNDILLYYPIIDRYSEPGRELLQHFDGMERNFVNTDFEHVSKWMLDKGYGFDFFSDRQLQKFINLGKGIKTGGNTYQSILLPANKLISAPSFKKLVDLAAAGATILVYKELPGDVPGLASLEKHKQTFNQQLARLKFVQSGNVRKAVLGKGAFIISNDMDALMQAAIIRKENLTGFGLSTVRRKNAEGYTYFINNRTDKAINEWIPIQARAASVALFDCMSGKMGLAKWRPKDASTIEVLLQLLPHESLIVQTYAAKKTGKTFPYYSAGGIPVALDGPWEIEFLEGGPVLPAKVTTNMPASWIELPGEDVKNFSGTASYTVMMPKPAGTAKAWLLDLGRVDETAQVFLNGVKIASLIGPNYHVIIPSSDLKEVNQLKIVVANLMANRISYMDKNNLPWKIFYNTNMPARKRENVKDGLFSAAAWTPLPSGLSGPVTLTPVNYE
jgi:hypothetical protein